MSRLASQSGTLSEDMDNWRDLAVTSLDIEEEDKETLHLLVFLFMHFLSYPNQTEIPDNKSCVKYLAVQKCFHSLYSLIGYDEVQQRFTTMPHKIRLAQKLTFNYVYSISNLIQMLSLQWTCKLKL